MTLCCVCSWPLIRRIERRPPVDGIDDKFVCFPLRSVVACSDQVTKLPYQIESKIPILMFHRTLQRGDQLWLTLSQNKLIIIGESIISISINNLYLTGLHIILPSLFSLIDLPDSFLFIVPHYANWLPDKPLVRPIIFVSSQLCNFIPVSRNHRTDSPLKIFL